MSEKTPPNNSSQSGASGAGITGPGSKDSLERTAKGPRTAGVTNPAAALPIGACPSGTVSGTPLPDNMVVNRMGGGSQENVQPKRNKKGNTTETTVNPIPLANKRVPGFSVTEGESPQEAADRMRNAFPNATQLHEKAKITGSATAKDIRAAGFEVVHDPTSNLSHHASIIHPDGEAGWTPENVRKLAQVFTNAQTPP